MGRLDRCTRLLVVLRRVRCCVLPFCDPFLYPVFRSMPKEPSFNGNYFSCRQGCVVLALGSSLSVSTCGGCTIGDWTGVVGATLGGGVFIVGLSMKSTVGGRILTWMPNRPCLS